MLERLSLTKLFSSKIQSYMTIVLYRNVRKGAIMVNLSKIVLHYTKIHVLNGQRPKSSSKMLFEMVFLSLWWSLSLSKILKRRISSCDLENLSSKVLLKSTWWKLVLNVDFMTLDILKLFVFSYSLTSLFSWGHHHKICNKNITSMLVYHRYIFIIVTCSTSLLAYHLHHLL